MKLYKYLTPERMDVLRNGSIRLTQPKCLNDPCEMAPTIESMISDSEIERKILKPMFDNGLGQIFDDVTRDVTHRLAVGGVKLEPTLVRQFIEERYNADPKAFELMLRNQLAPGIELMKEGAKLVLSDVQSMMNDLVGILSLSELATVNLMWAHYATSHTGFVIEFDGENQFFEPQPKTAKTFYQVSPVEYSPTRPVIKSVVPDRYEDLDDDTLMKVFFQPLLLTKSTDWSYEKEWRLIRRLKDSSTVLDNLSGNIHLYNFPPLAINRVITGMRMTADDKQKLQELISNPPYEHVSMARIEQIPGSYDLAVIDE